MFKRALVSVSDKTGLIEFLEPLVRAGLEIVSTGGTAKYLKKQNWKITDISEVTKFPEVLDGRVKTLHPFVHMGLLAKADSPEHQSTLKQHQVQAFDLVVGNLYPFEKALQDQLTGMDLIEKIDIGGPSFLRSAAKNFASLTVVCDPKDYSWIQNKNYQLMIEDRKLLASRVFRLISDYDQMIATSLNPNVSDIHSFSGKLKQKLRYGENEQQSAQWFQNSGRLEGLSQIEQLGGKELSYNNLLDLDAALQFVTQFQSPVAIALKHNNPCGAAFGNDTLVVLKKTLQSDPVSVFGGIIVTNFLITAAHAELLNSLFIECVMATDFSNDGLALLKSKKNLRLIKAPMTVFQTLDLKEVRSISGGFLLQDKDVFTSNPKGWKRTGAATELVPEELALFGEKVCAVLKSNAIAIVGNGQTLGLGMGQVNRVDAVEQAVQRWKKNHADVKEVLLVSDAFFPFPDSIEKCFESGIRWILQPGGSIKDPEVIQKAQELGIHMILTGQRHFRH